MDKTNLEITLTVDCFDTICRTCLGDLKETIVFNINDVLIRKEESEAQSTETLEVSEVLTKCTSIKVSKNSLDLYKLFYK